MIGISTVRDDYMHPLPVSKVPGDDKLHCYTDGKEVTLPADKMRWTLRRAFQRVLSFYGRNADLQAFQSSDLSHQERAIAKLVENGRLEWILATHKVGLQDLEVVNQYIIDHGGFACVNSSFEKAFAYTLARIKRESINSPELKDHLTAISHQIKKDLPPRLVHGIDTAIRDIPRLNSSADSVDMGKKLFWLFKNHSH